MNDAGERRKNFISEALVIAMLPIIAYGMAFYFEASYLENFGLPEFIITVSIERFFFVLLILLSFSLPVILLITIALDLLPEKMKVHWRLFTPPILTVILVIFLGIFSLLDLFHCKQATGCSYLTLALTKANALLCLLLAILLFLAIYIGYVRPYRKDKDNYLHYLQNKLKKHTEERKKNLITTLMDMVGVNFFLVIIFVIIALPIIASEAGTFDAHYRTGFLVTQINNKNYALLRTYENLFIYMEVKTEWVNRYEHKNTFKKSYLLLNGPPENAVYEEWQIKQERVL